ncbi:MAG TPA: DUF262 domain-containing protein [Gemmatimonadaceae bacterium]|nr:DUF262 domain-containing protein [Gemmatimonadaceae bacterium]
MKRRVRNWTVEELHKLRTSITFPEYQRQPNLWAVEKRRLLIDSILIDIDIPKLYFNQTKGHEYEVVDGTQRLWSLWEFVDGELTVDDGGRFRTFEQLSAAKQERIRTYELQVVVFENADDAYLRELFLRLQLGLLLVTGEKLNAATGQMRDFVFRKLADHPFIESLKIPRRRHANATLGAQIAVNSFARAKQHSFARTRYEDLLFFFQEYELPTGDAKQLFAKQTARIVSVMGSLHRLFGSRAKQIGTRSYVTSIYLLFEEIGEKMDADERRIFASFTFDLWARLRQEIAAGIERTNRELYAFQTMLSSAPGERYQIERRHEKLKEYFAYYRKHRKVKGD